MPIPDFANIKLLKSWLIKEKKKKVKYTLEEIAAAKAKVKPK